MSALTYRPDIDGLRAVAVLAVVLFHAGVPFMTGGFVGVDVFFVISGYLITSLILKDLTNGTFTFAGFWERRARRILPALCVMVAAVLTAGWFLFLPEDFAALGKQVAAQSVFGSNILFYKQAGYFDSDSYLKPLLHTWSLAVEEQYYILFPPAAYFVWQKFRGKIAHLLIASAILSFVLCVIVMRANPNLAFYMLPFRGWELLLGAILAYRTPQLSDHARLPLALAGLLAILAPVFLYNKDTIFPGIGALPPALGAAALIWAGSNGKTFITRALSWRPVVFVGLVSYSWYLWHWPVIVFAKYIPLFTYDVTVASLCVLGSFALAVLSWRYVERPFRRFELCGLRRDLFRASLATLIVLLAVGAGLILTNGLPARLDPQVAKYAYGIGDDNPHRDQCDKVKVPGVKADKICQTAPENGTPVFMVWGDSQADAIAPAFYALSDMYKKNGYVATHHGCPPALDYYYKKWDGGYDCVEYNHAIIDFIERHKVKTVYLVASWMSWMYYGSQDLVKNGPDEEPTKDAARKSIQKTFDRLTKQGIKVYVLLDVPSQGFDVPRVLAKKALYHLGGEEAPLDRKSYLKSRVQNMAALIKANPKITFIDPLDRMCPDDKCLYEYDGYSLYYNSGHVSVKGAEYLVPVIDPYFKDRF